MKTETISEPLVRTFDVTIHDRLGFHLRVVARFVEYVREFRSSIRIRKGKVFTDGKSILGLVALGATWKSRLEVKVVGDDAVQAIEGIKEFFLNQENINGSLL